ncbi:hypothetical protein D3C75_1331780 [compost metagenome]
MLRLASRKLRSTIKKLPATNRLAIAPQRHTSRMATNSSPVVMIMVSDTAIP